MWTFGDRRIGHRRGRRRSAQALPVESQFSQVAALQSRAGWGSATGGLPASAGAESTGSKLPVAPVHETGDLVEGLRVAVGLASRGDTVLFSPGARSFDQYLNFEARGDHFVRLVKAL